MQNDETFELRRQIVIKDLFKDINRQKKLYKKQVQEISVGILLHQGSITVTKEAGRLTLPRNSAILGLTTFKNTLEVLEDLFWNLTNMTYEEYLKATKSDVSI